MKFITFSLILIWSHGVAAALEDSFTPVKSEPVSLQYTPRLYPKLTDFRASNTELVKGQQLAVYIRYLAGDTALAKASTYSAAYFPAVDDYSVLSVPNCIVSFI